MKPGKLDRIEERLSGIEKLLERNTISLEEHMRRTALLEEEIRPLKRQATILETLYKLGITLIAALAAAKKFF